MKQKTIRIMNATITWIPNYKKHLHGDHYRSPLYVFPIGKGLVSWFSV